MNNDKNRDISPDLDTEVAEHVTIKVKTRLKAGANCCDAEPSQSYASDDSGGGGGGDWGGGGGDWGGGSDWA